MLSHYNSEGIPTGAWRISTDNTQPFGGPAGDNAQYRGSSEALSPLLSEKVLGTRSLLWIRRI